MWFGISWFLSKDKQIVLENLLQIVPFYPPDKYVKKQLNTQKLTQNVLHSVSWFVCRDVDPTCQWVCHEFSDEELAGFEAFPTHRKQLSVHALNQRMAFLTPVKMCQIVEHMEKKTDQLIIWWLQKHWHELPDNLPSEKRCNKRTVKILRTWKPGIKHFHALSGYEVIYWYFFLRSVFCLSVTPFYLFW